MTSDRDALDALTVARAYHRAWTSGEFDDAGRYLADDLKVDVPINSYPTKADFLAAVKATRQLAAHVEILSALGNDQEALLLYDLSLPIGQLRIAEHFVVTDGRITQIRHVHDTATLRAGGFTRALLRWL